MNTTTAMAQVGSCKCMTKTPDPEWHDAACPYRKLDSAQAGFDAWFLGIPDVDERLIATDGAGNYIDHDIGLMYAAYCAGIKA